MRRVGRPAVTRARSHWFWNVDCDNALPTVLVNTSAPRPSAVKLFMWRGSMAATVEGRGAVEALAVLLVFARDHALTLDLLDLTTYFQHSVVGVYVTTLQTAQLGESETAEGHGVERDSHVFRHPSCNIGHLCGGRGCHCGLSRRVACTLDLEGMNRDQARADPLIEDRRRNE